MVQLNKEFGTTFIFATHDDKVIGYLKRKISVTVFVVAVLVISTIDVLIVIQKGNFISPKPQAELDQKFVPDMTTTFLQQQPGLFRIFPLGELFMDNTFAYHGIQSIGGYSPAKLKIYQTLLDSCLYHGYEPGNRAGYRQASG